MNNLFKKGFASLALASAMTSSIFAGNAAYIDVKVEYVNTSKTDSKDESVTAFEMHIKKDNIVVNFDKSANHANSANIKLIVKKTVAGDRIKGAKALFKQASNANLISTETDAKIAKLTFTINQTDKANVLIISAASKKDLIAAMPIKVALSRIDEKMRLDVTRDRIGFKDRNTIHLFANNIIWNKWNKKKVILGNSNFKKQNAMTPQMNEVNDTSVGNNLTISFKKNIQNSLFVSERSNILLKPSGLTGVYENGKALASSVINTKDSVVATTTVGTAANNTYIINVNSDLDVNNSGEVLSFSVLDTKPSVVTAANNNINSTSSNVNTGSNVSFAKSFEKTFIKKINTENAKTNKYAGATNVTDLEDTTTAANTAVTMNNNTENVKINADFNVAYFTYDNSDTIGSFAAIASDNGELKKTIHYNYAG